MRYRVMHRYGSSTYGPWVEGDHVELNEDQAAWVNRDSEGTLKLVDPQEQAEAKRERQRLAEETRKREQEERDRREKTERISGVSQSQEPGRMDPGVSQADEEGRSPGGGQGAKAVPKSQDVTVRPEGDEDAPSKPEGQAKAPTRRGPGRPRATGKGTGKAT